MKRPLFTVLATGLGACVLVVLTVISVQWLGSKKAVPPSPKRSVTKGMLDGNTGDPSRDSVLYQAFVNVTGDIFARRTDADGRKLHDSSYGVESDGEWVTSFPPNMKGPVRVSVEKEGYLRDIKDIDIHSKADIGIAWHLYPGDIDGNDVIDREDLKLVFFFARPNLPTDHQFGRQFDLPKSLDHVYEETCDLDGSGKVDGADMKIVLDNLGRKAPVLPPPVTRSADL